MARALVCSFHVFVLFHSADLAVAKGLRRTGAANTREEVEASLLAELAGTFRPSATNDHILALEEGLRPMYAAVPQNADGTLGHNVVRYVLHRFFVQRGWFIRGLEGDARNSSTDNALQDLQEWVPSFLQGFLEQLAGGRGISLRELAVLAATMEDLIHKESVSRLEQAFRALDLPLDTKLDEPHIKEVLEVYMMIYMLGGNFTITNPAGVRNAHKVFTQKVKDWVPVQEWMVEVKKTVHPTLGPLDFAATSEVVEAIGERYGTYNLKECTTLKSELLDIESQKAGRVSLPDFYKQGLKGVFEFNEKIEYLRDLGALDENDPARPYVIVPNYVGSRPNCMVASSFYVVCCPNECEDLMGKLEREIGAELAPPDKILSLITSMSSDTVSAPRTLSETLKKRLYKIADGNKGSVPLHGRLFAQWMHHAYPRECPYPHAAGTTNPQTPDEWMQATGQQDSKASKEELMAHVQNSTVTPIGKEARHQHHFEENELPWNEAEELLVPTVAKAIEKPIDKRGRFRAVLSFLLLSSMGIGLVWAWRSFLKGELGMRMQPKGKGLPLCRAGDAYKLA